MFNSYDRLKVYYDNGQAQVKGILEEAFSMFSAKTELAVQRTGFLEVSVNSSGKS